MNQLSPTNDKESAESRLLKLHKLMRGWRWSYKGHPVGKWAKQNEVVWKGEKSCVK